MVAVFVAGIVVLGVAAAWQTYRQSQIHGEMMGHTAVHGPHPFVYLFGSILVAGVVAGAYWIVREQVGAESERRPPARADEPEPEPESDSGSRAEAGSATPSRIESAAESSRATPRVLDVLPEDERRILEPVVDSPGLTQIELRDRADFSKSKVSQTVTDLEKRGLLYREPQGRTYRVYPSDDLEER
ncbi:MarR family transcriptional regulator [Natronococcus pandeyae]|uniref:MarR family transcriptional regulator n=1 Tax=Natronococcus pandeyae TaxID=2055836 RepID=A0A8J8Q6G3_9EURY|nr:MarR family transcriptional regulator [Natronococcus pandeyae]